MWQLFKRKGFMTFMINIKVRSKELLGATFRVPLSLLPSLVCLRCIHINEFSGFLFHFCILNILIGFFCLFLLFTKLKV